MRKNSFLFAADPRLKLVMLLLCTASFFAPASPAGYGVLAAASALLTVYTCGFRNMVAALRVIFPILLLTALMSPLFLGISETVRILFRFTGITLLFYLYFRTTTSDDFILTLRFFGIPFRFALIISIASRYIPFLLRAHKNAEAAHRLRKTDITPEPGKWNIFAKVKAMLPVLTSVLVQAIKNIPVLAMALETRGLNNAVKPTCFRQITLRCSITRQTVLFFSGILFIIIVLIYL